MSFCLRKGRQSSGCFPEDQTQWRQPRQRQGPVPQCREQHSTEVEYCSTGVAAAWHLKNVQVSELSGVASARRDAAKGRDIRQPWKELFVPALGSSYASHIFLLRLERSHGRAVLVKGTSEGDCWGERTPWNHHEDFSRWAEAPSHSHFSWSVHWQHPRPSGHKHLLPAQSQGGTDPASPHFLIAFPPPFISFGFSPLIKLLACWNV